MKPSTRRWWAFTGVSIISFLGCIDLTIVNTAAPEIQSDLHASVTELQLIVNIFIAALSMFMVTMGRLADSHGRRLVLYSGTVVFGLASLGAGLATDVRFLIACRFVQGAACAVLYTSTSAIVSNAFPEEQRGKAIGALYGVNGIGLAIGPMLGGFIVSWLSWQWIFWLNVPLILIALAICLPTVQESRNEDLKTGVDWVGLPLITVGLPAIVLGLSLGDTWGWGSWRILALLGGGVLALIAFCFVERKVSSPIIQFRLFGNRMFISAIVADFSLAFFYCLAFFLMPLYLHSVRQYEGYATGLMLLPCTALVAVLSPVVGRLVDRFRPRLMLCIGFTAFALSALAQSQFTGDSSVVFIALAFALMGTGWAFVLGPATVAALSSVPERMGGTAIGSSWTFHNLGGALGLAAGMAIYRSSAETSLSDGLAAHHVSSGPWVQEAISKPESATKLLAEHTGLKQDEITSLFNDMSLSGNAAAMWLLLALSVAAFTAIAFGLREGKKRHTGTSTAPGDTAKTGAVGETSDVH